MATLAEVHAVLLPGGDLEAQPLADRPIAWVRVLRARVPAFDALERGDLVIVPGPALAVVAAGGGERRELVAALAATPVSGAILVDGDDGPGRRALDALAQDLRGAGIASLRVGRTDVPSLERSVVGFIVSRGAELERQVALLEAELERRALEGGGVAALVGTVAAFVGRPLVLEGPRGEIIASHAPQEAPGAAAFAVRYRGPAGNDAVPVALRVPLPGAEAGGSAFVLPGAERPSELARVTLPRVAGLVALELARDEAVRRATDRARRAEPMPGDGPPWVMVVARQRLAAGDDESPAEREAREALRRQIRLLAPARQLALRGDVESLEIRALVAGDESSDLVRRLAELAGRTVAVSRPFTSAADRPAAEAEARTTLETVAGLPDPPAIAHAARLPVYRMLGAVHKLPDGERLALELLAPLLDARPDIRRERLETLRALLEHGGVGEAAAVLGVHRNTIAYRLRRIEEATGWNLRDPDLRVPLVIALELVHEDQVQ